ncbi:50S ribosomal protein L21 [Candidatus Microgenomates bacterium]|nr:50S ribosomal protein L21 [Candidatus Microgenomates bacterium]
MKYAIVRISGHQYKVEEGQELLVDKLPDPKKFEAEVLLTVDGDKVSVGNPVVKSAKVGFKVLADMEKGEKIDVKKYKAKSRYRRHIGFRHQYSRLQVEKIS